jgi:prophage regulatory protein
LHHTAPKSDLGAVSFLHKAALSRQHPSDEKERTTMTRESNTVQRFIRLRDLPTFVGLQRTKINELIEAGEFPKPIPLSDSGRAVAWIESEVAAWQASRIVKRNVA